MNHSPRIFCSYYCSAACQQNDWTLHKKKCQTLRQTYKDLKAKRTLHNANVVAEHVNKEEQHILLY